MYKNGIKMHSIVFLLIFSKKTCKIINKCMTDVRNHTMNVKNL